MLQRFYSSIQLSHHLNRFGTMLTFDTGSNWGVQKSVEELRKEKIEREKELAAIAEEERQKKIEEAKKREARWEQEAKEAKEAAEKENQAAAQDRNRIAQERSMQQTQKKEGNNKQMSDVQKMEKMEEALKAVKKAKQERSNAMQRAARSSISNSSSSVNTNSTTSKPRGRVRVNPVTGALMAVEDNGNDGKVQEGCLRLDKKYMSAALAAGLGSGKGMYGHIGTIQQTFNSRSNTGSRPSNGPSYSREAAAAATGRSTGKGSMSRVIATKVGGTTVHSITSKTSNPSRQKLKRNPNFNRRSGGACDLGGNPIRGDQKRPPKNNVKRMVQGRTKSNSGGSSSSSYLKSKGVVATLGGATSASTQNYQDKKAKEQEAARRAERLADRKPNKPRRQAVTKTLGGASFAAPNGDAAALRAARLAALERRGIK